MDETPGWLVVVDMQLAFGEPGSPWYTPGFAATAKTIARLLPRFSPRVIFTRFVPPAEIGGSWRDYYGKWGFAADPSDNALWDLVAPWQGAPSVASHTFSKWVPPLLECVGSRPAVTLCGVSTDCCVLMTALAAVDSGAWVTVVADACCARSEQAHAAALTILAGRAPQLAIVTAEEALRRPVRIAGHHRG